MRERGGDPLRHAGDAVKQVLPPSVRDDVIDERFAGKTPFRTMSSAGENENIQPRETAFRSVIGSACSVQTLAVPNIPSM